MELIDFLAAAPVSDAGVSTQMWGGAASGGGRVLAVTLDRPGRLNALDLAAWERLAEVFARVTRGAAGADGGSAGADGGWIDVDLRGIDAVVVRGAGKAFSAGANIAEFPALRMTARAALRYNRAIAAALEAVEACPVPVVAMIDGAAVGGGCELAAACDVRIATERSRFGVPIGTLGVTLGPVEARAIARLVGPARLKELIFSGRLIDAREAHAIGYLERLVAGDASRARDAAGATDGARAGDATRAGHTSRARDAAGATDALHRETARLLAAILSSSPTTVRATKRVAALVGRELTAADADAFAELLFTAYEGEELREGVAAFTERRRPRFGAPAAPTGAPAPAAPLESTTEVSR